MNVVICGAGGVGRHAAEVLAAKANNITIIDQEAGKLAQLDEQLDVRSLAGNAARADILVEAGCAKANLFISATNNDEINLLAASAAKGVGAAKCIARVHHSAYFENHGLDYATHLGIDHLVCPEHSTALAIASALSSPGALAVENFACGRIQMQQWPVTPDAEAVGTMLAELALPGAARVAAVERDGAAFLPDAQTAVQVDDVVTLVGDAQDFDRVRQLFNTEKAGRRSVVILGGSAQSVWLCRAIHRRQFSVRLFEPNEARALELAEKLPWVTVLKADAVHSDAMKDERVHLADAFVALTDEDEQNILAAARAKALGVGVAMAVLKRPTYLHLLDYVGIDRAFSPPATAVTEIERLLGEGPVRQLASLSEGIADVYGVSVPQAASGLVNTPLREARFPARCIVAAVQRGSAEAFVPGANTTIQAGDTMIIIGPSDIRDELAKIFA